jgi:hypothetical protein
MLIGTVDRNRLPGRIATTLKRAGNGRYCRIIAREIVGRRHFFSDRHPLPDGFGTFVELNVWRMTRIILKAGLPFESFLFKKVDALTQVRLRNRSSHRREDSINHKPGMFVALPASDSRL